MHEFSLAKNCELSQILLLNIKKKKIESVEAQFVLVYCVKIWIGCHHCGFRTFDQVGKEFTEISDVAHRFHHNQKLFSSKSSIKVLIAKITINMSEKGNRKTRREKMGVSRRVSESGEDLCPVCSELVTFYAVGKCDHFVCYRCSTRMRSLCDQMYCAICRTELPKVNCLVLLSGLQNS